MLQQKSKAKSSFHCIVPQYTDEWGNEKCSVVTMSKNQKKFPWIWWNKLQSGIGCWTTNTRSYKVQERCIQTMCNRYVSTTRILLETEGKETEQWCSLQSAIHWKRNRNEKIHAAWFETVKQERHSNKIGKTYSSGVMALVEDQDQKATMKNANAQCKHFGKNDHQRKSSPICPFFQGKANYISTGTHMVADTVPVNTPKKYICIQCGWCKFALPCKSGHSNGGN